MAKRHSAEREKVSDQQKHGKNQNFTEWEPSIYLSTEQRLRKANVS